MRHHRDRALAALVSGQSNAAKAATNTASSDVLEPALLHLGGEGF